jgi:hypothetical protein
MFGYAASDSGDDLTNHTYIWMLSLVNSNGPKSAIVPTFVFPYAAPGPTTWLPNPLDNEADPSRPKLMRFLTRSVGWIPEDAMAGMDDDNAVDI